MGIYSESDPAILARLGERLRRHRLLRNITQQELARRTLLSIGTIKALEAGRGKLQTLVAVMRELELLHELETFLRPPAVSPLELADNKQPRQRARKRSQAGNDKDVGRSGQVPRSRDEDW